MGEYILGSICLIVSIGKVKFHGEIVFDSFFVRLLGMAAGRGYFKKGMTSFLTLQIYDPSQKVEFGNFCELLRILETFWLLFVLFY